MTKVAKLFATFLLAGLVLVVAAGPASALDVRSSACWSNCPIGGETKLF